LHSAPSITGVAESATRSVLPRTARDVYHVIQSDLRMSIWSEARCGLAVGNLGEIFQAWKAVAGVSSGRGSARAGVAVDGDDDADIAAYIYGYFRGPAA
jgi:hypothetical protein